ncbi:hypothetical protein Daesc_010604 [Daldinia eschscholtzii]|uniref:Uncharacterized protein n=1 Tax=Daldinia eschscholtzii TaxID=292717 RepID=A0AAX6M8M8_9PEZI
MAALTPVTRPSRFVEALPELGQDSDREAIELQEISLDDYPPASALPSYSEADPCPEANPNTRNEPASASDAAQPILPQPANAPISPPPEYPMTPRGFREFKELQRPPDGLNRYNTKLNKLSNISATASGEVFEI